MLFTHDAILEPLPANVAKRARELGLASSASEINAQGIYRAPRDKCPPDDWRLKNALNSAAEATLNIANFKYDDLRRHVREEETPHFSTFSAVHVKILGFLVFACHAVLSNATQHAHASSCLSAAARTFVPTSSLRATFDL